MPRLDSSEPQEADASTTTDAPVEQRTAGTFESDEAGCCAERLRAPAQGLAELERENAELRRVLAQERASTRALREAEERQREILVAAGIGTWEWDIARNHVTWSPDIEQLFGLPPGGFGGTYEAWFALLHPDDRELATRAVEAGLAGEPYQAELRFQRPDGTTGWQFTRGYLIRDAQGTPQILRGMVFDITELVESRKRATELAEKLIAQERFLRLITDAIPAMVGYVGTDCRYRFANKAYESWFGISPSKVLGMHMQELLGERNFKFMESFIERAISGEAVQYSNAYTMQDGSTRHVLPTYIPDLDENGKPNGFVVLALEVTAEVEARKRAELLAESARAANRAKDEFLAMLGHELRNPMAPITTAIELMKLRDSDAFLQERQIIERQVRHMARLLDDLLDVSRITRGKISLEQSPVNLSDCVAAGIELASPLLELHRHHLEVRVEPDLIVMGDPTRLGQVFSNLLTNAAKYTPEGGRIEVSSMQRDGQVEVCVRDSGVGIRAEMLPKVFELFMQESQTIDRSEGGLGLGLAIVHSLVTMHGGSVRAESAGEGHGSTFTVTLPVSVQVRQGDASGPSRPALSPRALKVLVVDDNTDAAELLAEALELMGHRVLIAADGIQALELVEDFKPHIALLDIGLPVMDGYEVARQIRAQGRGTWLIAVTGYGEERARDAAKQAGFDRHLTKPVDLTLLKEAVEGAPVSLPRD